jgi:hypothetical protein
MRDNGAMSEVKKTAKGLFKTDDCPSCLTICFFPVLKNNSLGLPRTLTYTLFLFFSGFTYPVQSLYCQFFLFQEHFKQ